MPSDAIRRTMQANRGKHTAPEMAVRRLVHALGYRYRLHRGDLPGRPDLAFGPRRAVIEVRGCFWHRHPGCSLSYLPKTNVDFWSTKFAANVDRDVRNAKALENRGWRVLVVWECEIGDVSVLSARIRAFLDHEASDGA